MQCKNVSNYVMYRFGFETATRTITQLELNARDKQQTHRYRGTYHISRSMCTRSESARILRRSNFGPCVSGPLCWFASSHCMDKYAHLHTCLMPPQPCHAIVRPNSQTVSVRSVWPLHTDTALPHYSQHCLQPDDNTRSIPMRTRAQVKFPHMYIFVIIVRITWD